MSYNATGTHRAISANCRDPTSLPTIGMLTSVSVYERNLSPEIFTTKVHQYMGFQRGIISSEKSGTAWFILFEATDIENSTMYLCILGTKV